MDDCAVSLQMLYKLKTSKLFDETYRCPHDADDDDDDDYPFAVHRMHLCVDSRLLCVAGNSHVILFSFSKLDASVDCPVSSVHQHKICTMLKSEFPRFFVEKMVLIKQLLVCQ